MAPVPPLPVARSLAAAEASPDPDAPAFRLAVHEASGTVVLGGELDRRHRHLFLDGLRLLATSPAEVWRIDLREVVSCDSSGLSALVEGHGLAHRLGRRLTVVRSSPCVQRLLVDAGLELLLCDPRLGEARPGAPLAVRRQRAKPGHGRPQRSAVTPRSVSAATTSE